MVRRVHHQSLQSVELTAISTASQQQSESPFTPGRLWSALQHSFGWVMSSRQIQQKLVINNYYHTYTYTYTYTHTHIHTYTHTHIHIHTHIHTHTHTHARALSLSLFPLSFFLCLFLFSLCLPSESITYALFRPSITHLSL